MRGQSCTFVSMLDLNLESITDFRVRNGGKSESYCKAFVDIPYSVSEAQTPSKHKQVIELAKQPPSKASFFCLNARPELEI